MGGFCAPKPSDFTPKGAPDVRKGASVIHPDEKQPPGRRGGAGLRAIAAGHDLGDTGRRPSACADLRKRKGLKSTMPELADFHFDMKSQ